LRKVSSTAGVLYLCQLVYLFAKSIPYLVRERDDPAMLIEARPPVMLETESGCVACLIEATAGPTAGEHLVEVE
jgi:hypothetical protein